MVEPHFLWHGQLPYGAEYWITPDADRALLRRDFEQMRAMDFNIARIFVFQNETEPEVFDFDQLDVLFDEAASAGIGLCPTYALGLPPWRAKSIGLDPGLGIPLPYLLDDPAYRTALSVSLQALVTRYCSHPGLWAWILWNEPRRPVDFYPPPSPTWAKFRLWLRDTYDEDIMALNAVWNPELRRSGLAGFEQISPEHIVPTWQGIWSAEASYRTHLSRYELLRVGETASAGQGWSNYGAMRDWLRFNVDALTDSIRWLSETTAEVDPEHPTHINPDGFLQNQATSGRDLRQLAQTVDVWGSSLHPGHHFSYIDAETQFPDAFAYYAKAIVSANKGGMSMITELQAGPNTWSGNKNFTPDSTDLVHWNLAALGAGIQGVIYWLWRPRPHGWEAGEWGLLHRDGRPTTRTEGAARIGHFLHDHAEWLSALQPVQPKVAILRSRETEMLSFIEGVRGRLPVARYQTLSEYGCFRALWRQGIAADFVDEAEVQAGILSSYRCVFVPYAEALAEETGVAIADFVRSGGWAYGETPLMMKSPVGFAYARFPGGALQGIFPTVLDTWPAWKAPSLEMLDGALPGALFVQPLETEPDDQIIAHGRDYPCALEREVGLGRVCYVGTALTLHVGTHNPAPEAEPFLAQFAARAGAAPLWVADGNAASYLLESDTADALVVLNLDREIRNVAVPLRRPYRDLTLVFGTAEFRVEERRVTLVLPPEEAVVLRLAR